MELAEGVIILVVITDSVKEDINVIVALAIAVDGDGVTDTITLSEEVLGCPTDEVSMTVVLIFIGVIDIELLRLGTATVVGTTFELAAIVEVNITVDNVSMSTTLEVVPLSVTLGVVTLGVGVSNTVVGVNDALTTAVEVVPLNTDETVCNIACDELSAIVVVSSTPLVSSNKTLLGAIVMLPLTLVMVTIFPLLVVATVETDGTVRLGVGVARPVAFRGVDVRLTIGVGVGLNVVAFNSTVDVRLTIGVGVRLNVVAFNSTEDVRLTIGVGVGLNMVAFNSTVLIEGIFDTVGVATLVIAAVSLTMLSDNELTREGAAVTSTTVLVPLPATDTTELGGAMLVDIVFPTPVSVVVERNCVELITSNELSAEVVEAVNVLVGATSTLVELRVMVCIIDASAVVLIFSITEEELGNPEELTPTVVEGSPIDNVLFVMPEEVATVGEGVTAVFVNTLLLTSGEAVETEAAKVSLEVLDNPALSVGVGVEMEAAKLSLEVLDNPALSVGDMEAAKLSLEVLDNPPLSVGVGVEMEAAKLSLKVLDNPPLSVGVGVEMEAAKLSLEVPALSVGVGVLVSSEMIRDCVGEISCIVLFCTAIDVVEIEDEETASVDKAIDWTVTVSVLTVSEGVAVCVGVTTMGVTVSVLTVSEGVAVCVGVTTMGEEAIIIEEVDNEIAVGAKFPVELAPMLVATATVDVGDISSKVVRDNIAFVSSTTGELLTREEVVGWVGVAVETTVVLLSRDVLEGLIEMLTWTELVCIAAIEEFICESVELVRRVEN